MKVEFTHTVEDFILYYRSRRIVRAARRGAQLKSRAIVRSQKNAVLVVAVTLFFGGLILSLASALYLAFVSSLIWFAPAIVIAFFLAIMLLSIILSLTSVKGIRRQFESDPTNKLPSSAEITDAGLHFATPISRSTIMWPGILGVVSLPQALYILETEDLAHIIPSRAFSNQEEMKTFAAEIESRTHQYTAV